jgi:tryptophan synthase alpha subunit
MKTRPIEGDNFSVLTVSFGVISGSTRMDIHEMSSNVKINDRLSSLAHEFAATAVYL